MGVGHKVHRLFFGKVMHGRLFPKRNNFTYGIYYLCLSLSQMKDLPIKRNRWGLLSFYDCDHGACDGSDLEAWARKILSEYKLEAADGEITLMCMPRILGYVFNPVSFWLCADKNGDLRAVLCEVNNTFGERHVYVCAHNDHGVITSQDKLQGEKVFHVSPLLEREGHYDFRFDMRNEKFGVWIDYFDGAGEKQLVTSLIGDFVLMDGPHLRKSFWRYPLVTFKAIILIHWQALKLLLRGINYVSKPKQGLARISRAESSKEKIFKKL